MAANKRILIVDDQQDLREHMAKMLDRSAKRGASGASLVQQMRSRLLGISANAESEEKSDSSDLYEVDTAGQGQEAFAMVKKAIEESRPYTVMFLDMRMPPGWDGLETAKRIREIDKHIEIVIMTAYADHDQSTIAKTVGTPDKLLYIKKPFQSEEIFQLCLCLTSKWNAEDEAMKRKSWLENLIRGMSKMKSGKAEKMDEVCGSVIKSLLTFTNAQKAFIVSLNESERTWILEHVHGIEASQAASFIEESKNKLFDCRATQSLQDKYLLPLRRETYSAVAVVYDVIAPSDPEWYKLLSLLVMTASEVLSSAAMADEFNRTEKLTSIGSACDKIAANCKAQIVEMLTGVDKIKNEYPASAAEANAIMNSGKMLLKQMNNLSLYGDSSPLAENEKIIFKSILSESVADLKQNYPDMKIDGTFELDGEASICGSKSLMKEAFISLAAGSLSFALKAKKPAFSVKCTLENAKKQFKIVFETDAPSLPDALYKRIFEPFAVDETDSYGLCFPIAKHIIQRHGGNIFVDPKFKDGHRFTIALPHPE